MAAVLASQLICQRKSDAATAVLHCSVRSLTPLSAQPRYCSSAAGDPAATAAVFPHCCSSVLIAAVSSPTSCSTHSCSPSPCSPLPSLARPGCSGCCYVETALVCSRRQRGPDWSDCTARGWSAGPPASPTLLRSPLSTTHSTQLTFTHHPPSTHQPRTL